jgi:RNA polymerase sigma factor (sigma-70 family)
MSPMVYIVDDDAALRDATVLFLRLHHVTSLSFASAEDFLAAAQPDWTGCLLLDLKLGGMDGLTLQKELTRRGIALPIVIVTAHGDVAATRAALKAGAFDFLEKPVDNDLLLEVVGNAVSHDERRRSLAVESQQRQLRVERLTQRERQVLELVALGRSHREIAQSLGISARTVEVYKSRLMEKLQARTLADVIRLAAGAGVVPADV